MDLLREPRKMQGMPGHPYPARALPSDDAFRWLFTTEYAGLVRTVFLIVHDGALAEDIAQEAFIELHTHWSKVYHYDRPGAWVRRVAIRLAVKHARREKRRALLERSRHVATPGPSPETLDADVVAAIRRLSPQQRCAVVLFYFEDRPMDEVASIMDCSVATGWVHLHRARQRLAAHLSEGVEHE